MPQSSPRGLGSLTRGPISSRDGQLTTRPSTSDATFGPDAGAPVPPSRSAAVAGPRLAPFRALLGCSCACALPDSGLPRNLLGPTLCKFVPSGSWSSQVNGDYSVQYPLAQPQDADAKNARKKHVKSCEKLRHSEVDPRNYLFLKIQHIRFFSRTFLRLIHKGF